MKKEEPKRGKILCKITREEVNSFKRLGDTRRGVMTIITHLTTAEDDLWKALREKYNLKDHPRIVIDSEKNVVRKLF